MKFLIQKINNEVRHDFSFALLEAIRFQNWLRKDNSIKVKYLNTIEVTEPNDIYPPIGFKPYHKDYCPVGSVEFVTEFLQHFYNITPRPWNIPYDLRYFTERYIQFNTTESNIYNGCDVFIKSMDKIKGFTSIVKKDEIKTLKLPKGNYQVSDVITIESEWRGFVYQNKLVGLHNYCGEFTMFPNVSAIKRIISNFKSAPIAYTIDFGVTEGKGTFVIEVHDFFSCGLYGFSDYSILPQMFYKWFLEYTRRY